MIPDSTINSDTASRADPDATAAELRHALRQPLNHIIGYSEFLLDEAKGRQLDDLTGDLEKICAAARTLSSLMDEVVVSRPSMAGQSSTRNEPQGFTSPASHPIEAGLPAVIDPAQGHLLVVDDDPDNCDLLSRRLRHHGYRISVAENGRQALDLIRREAVDLVLLDVLMPEMDGFASCEALKANGQTRDIPVIFMTALTDVVDKVRGFEIGAVDYITKPFQHEEVLARISAHLTLQRLKCRLQESERRLGCVIENAMDAIVTLSAEADVVLFNQAAERVFGCPAAEAIGHSGERFFSEGLFRVFANYVGSDAAAARPPIWLGDGTIARRADGESFPIEATLSQAVANGRPLFTLILRDVLDRQKAELERQRLLGLNRYLQDELRVSESELGTPVVGASQDFREVMDKVRQVAPTSATVLVLGETGTGKEVIARAIHSMSSRPYMVMVRLNCAAIPADLVESELFGHEKGAFTSALSRKLGRFELADQGTLFLDEVGELSLSAQAKLLRVLQEGEFERVGGSETRRVDVRIIAATNRNLQNQVRYGLFRADLYYRLNVFPITLPPLRERKKDLPLLIDYFVRTYAQKYGKRIETVSAQAMTAMQAYGWPGNARELQHVIERAVIVTNGIELAFDTADLNPAPACAGSRQPLETLEQAERAHISQVLAATNWRVSGKGGAAELLGLKPSTLEFRMKKLGIVRPR